MVKAGAGNTRTLIKVHSTALVKALIERSKALSSMHHKPTTGQLRELFVSAFLKSLLPTQFGIGTGVVVSQKGKQSTQTDVVIYDNTILPPFIREEQLGVYPADCVCGTIEIKTNLTRAELLKAEEAAKKLHQEVFNPENNVYEELFTQVRPPICGVFGFYGTGMKELRDQKEGSGWLTEHIQYLGAICIVDKLSWFKGRGVRSDGSDYPNWTVHLRDKETNEETKRFIAVLLDNARARSQQMWGMINSVAHWDFTGIYIRDQQL